MNHQKGPVKHPQVPEHWKAPLGPYRQAPPAYGSEWWLVSPFTSSEPWIQFGAQPEEALPAGFLAIFGARPEGQDYIGYPAALATARGQWEQDLLYFLRAGRPDWVSAQQQQTVDAIFEAWEMGPVSFYEGRYGWMARWPQSAVPDFEQAAWTAANYPHQVVAQYQIRMAEREIQPAKLHPFTPPHVFGVGDES